jgi:transposase
LVEANTSLVAQVAAKDAEIATKEAEVNALKFQLDQLRRMLFGSKRERFVSSEHPLQTRLEFDIDEQELETAIEADKQEVTYTREKARKPHPGRLELPSHLPVVETIIEPEADTTGMKHIGDEVTDELDYTPAKLFINRIIRPKYITPANENGSQKQVIAELDRPIPRCIAGTSLLAHVLVMKFVFHMPLHRQLQVFKMEGVHINPNTLDSWMSLAAAHVRPLYAVHKAYVLESNYLQVDESSIKVLDRDKPGATHHGYMWVYHSPPHRAVFFEYKRGRGADAPKANLLDHTGFLQSDGYVAYNAYDSKEGVVHLSCWAHARRKFDKALDNDRARASHVLALLQQLYGVERIARDGGYTPEQRHALRLEKSLPLLNQLGKYIADNRDRVLPRSPIGHAFEYCLNRWDKLMNYLKDGILEIDSNLVENAIRPLALGRKNYLFAGSHDAAQNIAMFYSFFATCKMNDINPHKWLEHVIRNINDTKTSQLKKLLPQFIDKSLLL